MSENVSKDPVSVIPPQEAAGATETAPVKNKYGAEKQRKKMSTRAKVILFSSIALIFIAGVVFLIMSLISKGTEQTVNTGFVSRGTLQYNISGWGTISAKTKSELGQKTKGVVTEINVKVGDTVKEGDVILSVDPSETQKELDTALSDLDLAAERLNLSQKDIYNLTARIPFSGKLITETDIKVGDTVSAGQSLGTFVDDTKMKLKLYFSYAYIDDVYAGMPAEISIPQSMANISGKVESVEKVKKISSEGAVMFRVNFVMDNPGTLTKDMIAVASMTSSSGEIIMPSESGVLEYMREEEILAKSSGEVVASYLNAYYTYKSGDALIVMKNESLDTALASAQRSYETQQAAVDKLKESLEASDIVSPIDGIVTALMVEVDDTLTGSGTPIVTISNLSSMVVDITIDEMDVSKVSVGMPVEILYDKTDGQMSIMGEVISVSLEASSQNSGGGGGGGSGIAYFPARIAVDNPGDLMPGMGINYNITSMVSEDCLMVPSSAIIYTESGTTVFVRRVPGMSYEEVDVPKEQLPDGFVAVPVTIGLADNANTEIISGLEEGDEVYVSSINNDPYGMGGIYF